MAPQVRLARIDDAPQLDHGLADAFFGHPLNDWLLPGERHRNAALQRGIGHVMREKYLPHGGAWTTDDLAGVAMLREPRAG